MLTDSEIEKSQTIDFFWWGDLYVCVYVNMCMQVEMPMRVEV